MWQAKERLTPQQWDEIFDLTAQAYQGMIAQLKGGPNWDFIAEQERWIISPRLLDQLTVQLHALEQERGKAIIKIASCNAHRSLAAEEMEQNYHGVTAQCYFGLENRGPKVGVSIRTPHHQQLDVAPRFVEDIVGKEVITTAEKQDLVAPKQRRLYDEGLTHADEVWIHWDFVHRSHPRAKRG